MVAARAGEQARVDLSARPACRLQGTIQARHARPQPGNGIRQCLTGGRDLPRWIGDAEDEQIVAAPPPTTPDVFDRLLASAAMLGDRSRLHVVEDAENRPEDIRSTIAPSRTVRALTIETGSPELQPRSGKGCRGTDRGTTERERNGAPSRHVSEGSSPSNLWMSMPGRRTARRSGFGSAERRRSRTYRAVGCTTAPVLKTSDIHRRLQVKRGLRGARAPVCAPVLRTAQDSRAGRARGWAARLCFEIVGMASREERAV